MAGDKYSCARNEFNAQRYSASNVSATDMFRVKSIVKLAGKGRRILDIGCGDGSISALIAQNDNDVYGNDISDSALREAQAKGIKALRIDIECEGLPFPDNYFDTVIAGEIIEHIFDTDRFLEEIKRALKPEGHLIITTPNLATLGRRLLLLFGINPHMEVSLDQAAAGHIRYFVKKTLLYLLEKHNFKIDTVTSDIVNFNRHGSFYSTIIPKIFPTLGRTLIVKATNIKE